MGILERTSHEDTVLETDTGGQVRDAPRHRANGSKGTRPSDSVTSGQGGLPLREGEVAVNGSVRLGNNTTIPCKRVIGSIGNESCPMLVSEPS